MVGGGGGGGGDGGGGGGGWGGGGGGWGGFTHHLVECANIGGSLRDLSICFEKSDEVKLPSCLRKVGSGGEFLDDLTHYFCLFSECGFIICASLNVDLVIEL